MIAAIDVHYEDDSSATVGAVIFKDFSDSEAYRTYTKKIPKVRDYVSGQFYKRELPCIMAILGMIEEEVNTIIIDGYVELGDRPGLGKHLWKALEGRKTIIGVAKSHFLGAKAIQLHRGKSRLPLYITAAGMDPSHAAGMVAQMHGKDRLPVLLKQADTLSRRGKTG
jgi:deoxyribonuclease V